MRGDQGLFESRKTTNQSGHKKSEPYPVSSDVTLAREH